MAGAERTAVVKLTVDSAGVKAGVDRASRDLGKLGEAGAGPSRAFRGVWHNAVGLVGGDFADLADKISGVFETLSQKGAAAKVAGLGGAAAAVGALVTQAGSGDQQAADQLKQAVTNAGADWETYAGQIEDTIKSQENFGHGAADTQEALRKMTQATNDPAKALANMGLVANLAAAQHISLSDAAGLVDRIMAGKGGRTLAQYGITMGKTKDHTKAGTDALAELSKKLDGQASVSVDNYRGKLSILQAKTSDTIAQFGQKFGPALMVAGPALMVFSGLMETTAMIAESSAAKTLATWTVTQLGMIRGVAFWAAATIAEYVAAGAAAVASGLAAAAAWAVVNAPLLIVIGIIALLVGAVVYAWNHFKWFHDGVVKVWDGIKTVTQALWDFWKRAFNGLMSVITVVWSAIKGYVTTYINVIKDIIGAVMAVLSGNWSGAWGNIKDAFMSIWKYMNQITGGLVQNIWNSIWSVISGWVGKFQTLGSNIINGLINGIRSAIGGVISVVQGLWNSITGIFHMGGGGSSPSVGVTTAATAAGRSVGVSSAPRNPPQTQSITTSSSTTSHVNVYLDGSQLHSSAVRQSQRYRARNGATGLA